MSKTNEAALYRKALQDAEEHLSRWQELGTQLGKTLDSGWQSVLMQRQAGVKQLELLIQLAEQAS
jgi:hypothetical protein